MSGARQRGWGSPDRCGLGRASRLYALFLRLLLPEPFRREAEPALLVVFAEAHEDAAGRGGVFERIRFWRAVLVDLGRTAVAVRLGRSATGRRLPERRRSTVRATGPRHSIETLLRDLRHALRVLARSPLTTALAVSTLALAIGANTAIFSVVDAVVLRPLPFPEPDRLVAVWADNSVRSGRLREWLSYPNFHDLRQSPGVFEEIALYDEWRPTLSGDEGQPEVLAGALVTHGMLAAVLGVEPSAGRSFLAREDQPDAPSVVLLGHGLWQRRFGGDPAVVGRSITLSGEPYTVIGVLPARFRAPFLPRAQIFALLRQTPERHEGGRGSAIFRAVGRLEKGVSLDTARAAATALGERLAQEYPDANTGVGFALFPYHEDLVLDARLPLLVLLGAVGLVLLISCINVATLQLAQVVGRTPELALRRALGGGRRAIVRQLLTESGVVALLGGLLGAGFGFLGMRLLVRLAPAGTPRIDAVRADGRVLVFTALVTIGVVLLAGLVPSLRGMREARVHQALRQLGRGVGGGATQRIVRPLVVIQVAMAVIVLVGSGLLLQTFRKLTSVDLGFDTERGLAVTLDLPAARYGDPTARINFFDELERRVAALPGVATTGAIDSLPLTGFDGDSDFGIEGRSGPPPGQEQVAWIRRATPGYFSTLGVELRAGRPFRATDSREATRVALVNEALVHRYFPEESPVGRRLVFGDPADPTVRATIIGVAANVRNFQLREDDRPAIYFPFSQFSSRSMTLVLRTDRPPATIAPLVRSAIADLDPLLAPVSIVSLSSVVGEALAADRFAAVLMALFACTALVLAVVGLYGVVSCSVSLRRREMGVRMALGAGRVRIGATVVAGGLGLVAIGVGIGVLAASLLSRALAGLLYGVTPTDTATYATAVLVLLLFAAGAATAPALRAGRLDPLSVLNQE